MKISPARSAAFDVLMEIEKQRSFSSILLPAVEETLGAGDRGLCHQLVLGTLRKQIYLDRVVDFLSKGRRIDLEVRMALRLALFQLKFLDRIPPHSAVNESVNLVHRAKKSSARPFVNAILRRSLREEIVFSFADDLDRLSVETSHPRWLLEKWSDAMGQTAARELADVNNIHPKNSFRLVSKDSDLEGKLLHFASQSTNVPGCYITERPEPSIIHLARENKIYLQDEGSQMVAHAVPVRPNGRVLDVCASPGGKTAIIATRARSDGAAVVAGDATTRRIKMLSENCSRQEIELEGIVQYDAAVSLPFDAQSFDSVLVDAPCSGTGTIRHNPELRYFVEPEALDRYASKQLSILISASEMTRPGGYLIYSTCSLEKEENEDVCESFLQVKGDFYSIRPDVPQGFVTSSGYARTLPQRDDMDGFFVAAFQRR